VRNAAPQTLLISTVISVAVAFAGYILMGLLVSLLGGAAHLPGFRTGMWTMVPMLTALMMIGVAAVSSILVGWFVAQLSNKKFGFVNGDCLGASNEISKVMFLFLALIVVGFYTSQYWW